MNYFELFEIPISFEVDLEQLTQRYYALSKAHHPDKFSLHSEEAQFKALNKSTEINSGFKILRDKQKRIKYILELLGVNFTEGQEKVSQEFLMEMMDINEKLMDYQMDNDPALKSSIEEEINEIESTISDRISPVMKRVDFNDPDDTAMAAIKDYYLKSQYLRRLRVNLNH